MPYNQPPKNNLPPPIPPHPKAHARAQRRLKTYTLFSTLSTRELSGLLETSLRPYLIAQIRHLDMPNFYWLSGAANSGAHNPYFQIAAMLTKLRSVRFALHAAGITALVKQPKWKGGDAQGGDEEDIKKAARRRVMSVEEVVSWYELDGVFACGSLREVRIQFVESERTCLLTRGEILPVVKGVRKYLKEGFMRLGRGVRVVFEC